MLNDEISLPSVPDIALLGREWLSKYNELVYLKEDRCGNGDIGFLFTVEHDGGGNQGK